MAPEPQFVIVAEPCMFYVSSLAVVSTIIAVHDIAFDHTIEINCITVRF